MAALDAASDGCHQVTTIKLITFILAICSDSLSCEKSLQGLGQHCFKLLVLQMAMLQGVFVDSNGFVAGSGDASIGIINWDGELVVSITNKLFHGPFSSIYNAQAF